jgi:hypothetical protein
LSIHANFSVAATSTQISLYSISVSSLFILLFFTILFFFSFSWILSAPCNETWRESGNLLVLQCACLHIFLAASYLSRFVRSLRYRLISKPLVEISNNTYQISSPGRGNSERLHRNVYYVLIRRNLVRISFWLNILEAQLSVSDQKCAVGKFIAANNR